ncbi:MAG: alpha/beta fold hydrolase [Acidobacteria bacterium]|nr:alpha/beta fold hydrolase [Acidobacteriota bacterium]MBV9476890.1 alpha/beta fold hydrolase [Acidobacteriota bacterium]
MKRLLAVVGLCLFAFPLFADAVSEVRATEIAFAKAFADRDAARFFSMVADDATFLSLRTLHGKQAVVDRWSRLLTGPAPFRWGPERVAVSADGKIGWSTGPVYDAQGNLTGNYNSVWRKEADGSWKIIFDSGSGAPALPENNPKVEEGFIPTPDGAKLHYRRIGDGPFTMIVPLETWLYDAFRQFSDFATVIAYDPRDRGRSSHVADVKTLTIQNDVADLETVRQFFKVDKFVPVGWSYLGKMVAMYAAAHPEHVERLVQIGPAANHDSAFTAPDQSGIHVPDDVLQKRTAARANANATQQELCAANLDVMRYALVTDPAGAQRIDLAAICGTEGEQTANITRHFEALWPTITGASLSADELKKIAMPVLTIHGTNDHNAVYAGGRDWAMTLPNARFVSVPGAAHAAWLDHPETVFAAIRTFMRGDWPLAAEEVRASR